MCCFFIHAFKCNTNRLYYAEPARVTQKFLTVEARVEERANMECAASGESPIAIEWLDNNNKRIERATDKRFM